MAEKRVGVHGTDKETGRNKGRAEIERSTCPITAKQFMETAPSVKITIEVEGMAPRTLVAVPKLFTTNSFGWHVNEKLPAMVDGKLCNVQGNLGLTLVGSKEAARE